MAGVAAGRCGAGAAIKTLIAGVFFTFVVSTLYPSSSAAQSTPGTECKARDIPTFKVDGAPVPGRGWCVKPAISARRLAEHAGDVSAVACVSATHCIVASDETRFVEVVRLDRNAHTITPIRFVYLEDTDVSKKGNDKKKPKELDIEGAAVVDNNIALTGSHGLSRKGNDQSERFGVFLVDFEEGGLSVWPTQRRKDDEARPVAAGVRALDNGPKGMVHRLFKHLARQAPEVFRDSWTRCLQNNGFNIEGLASHNNRMFFGLRSPVDGDAAFVISENTEAYLKGEIQSPELHMLKLETGAGIRALEPFGQGFLVLSGTSQAKAAEKGDCAEFKQGEGVVSALWYWGGPGAESEVRKIGEFTKKSLTPEAMTVFRHNRSEAEVEVLFFFDGEANGGPVSYRIPVE